MAHREPTIAELREEEQRLLKIREDRTAAEARAEELAAKDRAEMLEKHRADPNAPRVEYSTGANRLSETQVAEAVAAYRAQYTNADAELAKLAEARLVAAFKDDGYQVPPPRPIDRLRELKARQPR